MNHYILKHKDVNVLKFSFNDSYEVDKVIDIYTEKHIPPGVVNSKNLAKGLQDWWSHRCIPASRDKLEEGLKILNIETVAELIGKSYGLSLSDHYWITENKELKWEKVNFYDNIFSDDVGKALFDNIQKYQTINNAMLNSPDNSSDGNLRKKWIIDEGRRFLLKGGDIYSPQESFNEVIAAELMARLGINHAEYQVLHDGTKHVFYSKTLNFTSQEIELINANHVITSPSAEQSGNPYEWFVSCCQANGIQRDLFERDLVQMFFVDFIIGNKDRHYRNFGFLRNSETLEWIGLAPVYDSGNSLFEGLADIDLENPFFISSKNIPAKPFSNNHEDQMKLLPIEKYCNDLPFNNLGGFSSWLLNLLKNNYRLSDKRKEMIAKRLEERIIETKEILKEPRSCKETKKNRKLTNQEYYSRQP